MVRHTHRESWCRVELGGYCLASTGGRMVKCEICRVNRQILLPSYRDTTTSFSSINDGYKASYWINSLTVNTLDQIFVS